MDISNSSNVWDVTSTQRKILSTARKEQKVLYKKTQQKLGITSELKPYWFTEGTSAHKVNFPASMGKYKEGRLRLALKNRSASQVKKYGRELLVNNEILNESLKTKWNWKIDKI